MIQIASWIRQKVKQFYALVGKPVIGFHGKWYKYIKPRRLTFKENLAIYKWLWWNFSWYNKRT